MAHRLIQIHFPATMAESMVATLGRAGVTELRHDTSGESHQIELHLSAEQVESVLDPVQSAFGHVEGFRVFVLAVEAVLPVPEEEEEEKKDAASESGEEKPKPLPSRISREELYADLSGHACLTRTFLAMVALSAIVAAVGLSRDNAAVVIGAMVMAPLLGPNMALSLGTTLGDTRLAWQAVKTTFVGFLLATVIAVGCGLILQFDPNAAEIVSRTHVGPGDVTIALAAGIAGALSFTTGVSGSLVGVMVAVALLPPLVVSAMLMAKGDWGEAMGAVLLLLCNVISINLAGVGTFLVQGVSPRSWWDAERSKRLSRRALAVWVGLLIVVSILIYLSRLTHEG